MINGALRGQVDKLWAEFWTGGITNPLTVIEQISYLLFLRMLDLAEARGEKRASVFKKPYVGVFTAAQQHARWSRFKNLDAGTMMVVVRDEVFPHLRAYANAKGKASALAQFLGEAQLIVAKPGLLVSAVQLIDALPLTEGDTKGDLYEYLLSKLTTAGINGQFRTPRHLIRFMCELVEPKPDERVADPACGTAGFLVGALQYLYEKHSSKEGTLENEDGSKTYTGDLLEPYRAHLEKDALHGFDFDQTMLRIATMNLMLHGVDAPQVHAQDALSGSFEAAYPKLAASAFDVILANPPFTGSLDEDDVAPSVTRVVKTKKTELLFLALILRMLKKGGRCAVVVPDGVLFGSTKAHKALRRLLVEQNALDAVISLPSGVFKPYAGVSTAILVFTKAGQTREVFFYDVAGDGFSLDDKRQPRKESDDLPDALAKWRAHGRDKGKDKGERTGKYFVVPLSEIEGKEFDLSINRYKETKREEVSFEPPRKIIARLRGLEAEIARELGELEGML